MVSLSVVMSVYNGATYLSEAVDSIRAQSYRDFEFIIVDDGSSDATSEILEGYARKEARINVITLAKNKGLPHALNLGVRKASGDIIARMDCDDVSMPERFEQQLKIVASSGADLVGTACITLSPEGEKLKTRVFPNSHEAINHRLPYGNCISHPSVMVKKSVLETVGRYNEEYLTSQDYELWLRLLPHIQMRNMDAPLIGYRKHKGRISDTGNRSVQTHYSVCAALNYFRAGFDMKYISPKNQAASVIDGFYEVFEADISERERQCLNRHVIRYGRNCLRDKRQIKTLRNLLFDSASTREKCKWLFYQMTG